MRGRRRSLVPVTAAAAALVGVALAGCSSSGGNHPGTGEHTSAAISPTPTAAGSAPAAAVTGCPASGGTPV